MSSIHRIQRLNESELESLTPASASWHSDYAASAWIYAGSIPFDLTEGDILAIFSQFGEINQINLIRHQDTGKSKGYAFLKYEDQRSTVLAVDNLSGAEVLGRKLQVDHVKNPKEPRKEESQGE